MLCPGEFGDVLIQMVPIGGYSGKTEVAVHIHALEVQIENVGCCASKLLLWRRLLSKHRYAIGNTSTCEHSLSVGFEKAGFYGIESTRVLHSY
jgi:hypothetical protein